MAVKGAGECSIFNKAAIALVAALAVVVVGVIVYLSMTIPPHSIEGTNKHKLPFVIGAVLLGVAAVGLVIGTMASGNLFTERTRKADRIMALAEKAQAFLPKIGPKASSKEAPIKEENGYLKIKSEKEYSLMGLDKEFYRCNIAKENQFAMDFIRSSNHEEIYYHGKERKCSATDKEGLRIVTITRNKLEKLNDDEMRSLLTFLQDLDEYLKEIRDEYEGILVRK